MTKKTTTITILTILTILILIIAVGGFWYTKNQQKENVAIKEKQEQGQEMNSEKEKENQKEEEKIERETIKTKPQLSKEEIEKLKKEKDLVWYEVPELGIKFLVTKDTKEDLGYKKDDFNFKTVALYSKSEIQVAGRDGCFDKKGNVLCSLGKIVLFSNKKDKFCSYNQIKTVYDDINKFCFIGAQASSFESYKQYEQYLEIIKNKNFGIYLNTIRQIDN